MQVAIPPKYSEKETLVKKNLGMLLLGIWLLVQGLSQVVTFNFSGMDTIMAVLAIAAGALIILNRSR
jgi:hypothetical protein